MKSRTVLSPVPTQSHTQIGGQMRVLVHWDDESESDLIGLYLNVDPDRAVVHTEAEWFLHDAEHRGPWDVVLMTTNRPDHETALENFQAVRRLLPDCPIVGACHQEDLFRIAGFLTHGLRAYVIRDAAGDYMFLLQTTLQNTIDAVRAERERLIADRLREEVESVRKLQETIMPQEFPSPREYQICGRYESSQIRVFGGQPVVMAGGDYYDVFRVADDDTVVLLGDASGHGMKACMSIMTMHTLIRMIHDKVYNNTAAFVAEINKRLYKQTVVNEDGGFITMLYGSLRSDTHEFQWTSAGHPLPILQNLETNEVKVMGGIDDGGMPLGILPEVDYEWKTLPIPPKSRLMIYTDGLQEAFPDGDMEHGEFGIPGIFESLKNSAQRPLEEALAALFDDSLAFTNGAGRHDDTSVVLIERD